MKNKIDLLWYVIALTGFFLLLEISFFIQCNQSHLFDLLNLPEAPAIPKRAWIEIAYFIMSQLLLHACFAVSVWVWTLLIVKGFPYFKDKIFTLLIALTLIAWMTVNVANQYYFPNSTFAQLLNVLLPSAWAGYVLSLLGSCIFIFIGLASVGAWKCLIQYKFSSILFCALAMIGAIWSFGRDSYIGHAQTNPQTPNIILIGVDSLRPDFLNYFGGQSHTPFLQAFLTKSTVFSEALTPIARTFPAWISLLTGRYPRENGIRTNLANQAQIVSSTLLPVILQEQGYETIYASDETRFSNIKSSLGFDTVITPPMGINDFLLGHFNDFPLSNLLINTPIGKILFPYSYGNRPVYVTYQPESFLQLLKPILMKPKTKPLFLAVHFCLPHYPYLWAQLSAKNLSVKEQYVASIERVDKILQDFLQLLQQAQLLDHAIVVLLSDHGEALELSGDRITDQALFVGAKQSMPHFYPTNMDGEGVNQSVGHGTDVLSLSQYQTLLAFKLYGMGSQYVGKIPGWVSLLDVKPTVLDLIHLTSQGSGQSLANVIRDGLHANLSKSPIFLETDFTPEAIRTINPEIRKVLLESINFYQIEPKLMQLTIKATMEEMIIRSKQYANVHGQWMLALYPQSATQSKLILVNLKTGKWTDDMQSDFARNSPYQQMLNELSTFYKNEWRI